MKYSGYSLPSKVTTELYTLGQSDSYRQKIIQASYDNYGNILRSVDAMGTEKDYQYQPLGALKAGQLKNMPLSDQDFVKYIQKLTIKPYKEVTDTTLSQPILFMYTNFDYAPVTVHSIDIQKLISKGVGYNDGSDHLYTHQSWKYNDAKDNQELLLEDQQGLPLSTSLSLVKDNSIKDSENITEDYDYKVLSSGNLQYSSTLENPLITSRNVVNNATGLKIEQISPNGSYVKYNYDSMRRVLSKELCDTKGQSISKERYNYYYVGSSACPDMAYNCKIEALPSGLKTASSYNGLNEEVESWIKPDGASKWLVVQKKNYNNLGKVISKTVIGYRSKSGVSESDLVEDTSVTIGYKYDILGRLVETTLATGVRQEAVYEAGVNRQIALSLPVDNKSLSFITVIDKNNAGKTIDQYVISTLTTDYVKNTKAKALLSDLLSKLPHITDCPAADSEEFKKALEAFINQAQLTPYSKLTISYDGYNRIKSKCLNDNGDGKTCNQRTSYTYTPSGLLYSTTYNDGHKVIYDYDPLLKKPISISISGVES